MNIHQYRLEELAKIVNGELIGQADFQIVGLASLAQAKANQISFVNGDKYLDTAVLSTAGALIIKLQHQELPRLRKPLLFTRPICFQTMRPCWSITRDLMLYEACGVLAAAVFSLQNLTNHF